MSHSSVSCASGPQKAAGCWAACTLNVGYEAGCTPAAGTLPEGPEAALRSALTPRGGHPRAPACPGKLPRSRQTPQPRLRAAISPHASRPLCPKPGGEREAPALPTGPAASPPSRHQHSPGPFPLQPPSRTRRVHVPPSSPAVGKGVAREERSGLGRGSRERGGAGSRP